MKRYAFISLAILTVTGIAGYVALSVAGRSNDAIGLLSLIGPALLAGYGKAFLDEHTQRVEREISQTRAEFRNGGFREGLLHALDDPAIQDKMKTIIMHAERRKRDQ